MSTPRTDAELEQKIVDSGPHSRINVGETMFVIYAHEDATDANSKAQSDHAMAYFEDGKLVWKRLHWRGMKTIDGVNGPFEVNDYEEYDE